MSISMVTNRTQEDYETAKLLRLKLQTGVTLTDNEKQAFERGSCTTTMLNRIENAQKELATRLNSYGIPISISNVTTWSYARLYYGNYSERVINNLKTLLSKVYKQYEMPKVPNEFLSIKNANDFEKLHENIEIRLDETSKNFKVCGQYTCGGGIF